MNYEELKRKADAGDLVSQEEYATACYNSYVKDPLFHDMKKMHSNTIKKQPI